MINGETMVDTPSKDILYDKLDVKKPSSPSAIESLYKRYESLPLAQQIALGVAPGTGEAISAYETPKFAGEAKEAARVRKIVTEQKRIDQTVVQGDQVTKTEIKDSVLNRSNIGSGGDDKFTKLKELKEMLTEGLIDDDEFKQMMKEILGK